MIMMITRRKASFSPIFFQTACLQNNNSDDHYNNDRRRKREKSTFSTRSHVDHMFLLQAPGRLRASDPPAVPEHRLPTKWQLSRHLTLHLATNAALFFSQVRRRAERYLSQY